jgi:hypothetical protein
MDESSWDTFAQLCETKFNECEFKNELLNLCGEDKKLAAVIYYQSQANALKWIHRSIPALGNKTPLKSITSQPNKLKSALISIAY